MTRRLATAALAFAFGIAVIGTITVTTPRPRHRPHDGRIEHPHHHQQPHEHHDHPNGHHSDPSSTLEFVSPSADRSPFLSSESPPHQPTYATLTAPRSTLTTSTRATDHTHRTGA
ncbi:hypothetical protein [Nocardia sp. AG03]|uniref:hypothetical protein n=1 Tax=Nocardia sp. AG03 TaxID=3025312 RepID=UPI0024189E74|nr:hypothetical protein [Nocardia sp. AG03]